MSEAAYTILRFTDTAGDATIGCVVSNDHASSPVAVVSAKSDPLMDPMKSKVPAIVGDDDTQSPVE